MSWDKIKERLDSLLRSGQHGQLRGALMMLNEVDIAEYLKTLKNEELLMAFRVMPKDMSSDVFSYMETEERQRLVELISDGEISTLIDEMFLDDAVDFIEELPANVVKRVLQNTDIERRNAINQFLRYPDNSAGSIMTIEYVEFHAGINAREAIAEIKRTGIDKETIYTIYIIDRQRRLTGTVALRRLIMAEDDAPIESLMNTNVIYVRTLDDQETVADTVRKYDLISIPVVDTESRLVGIITVDDIVDVIEEENTEDFEKMGALIPSEDDYMKTSVFRLALNRIPWLLILMISATFTGMIITGYEDLLTNSGMIGIALTACIPMLMDTGGNAGSQASTLVIRNLALGNLRFGDILKVLWKEIRVAVVVGAVLALVNFARLTLVNRLDIVISLVVSVSMYLTIILAKALGCTLPMLAKRIHLDPALMASPLITTIVDACALMIMFTIATYALGLGG